MGDPDPSLVQGETVASESPLAPSQAGSIGEHGIAVQRGPESNPQPQLNTHQWTLKEKFGLPERACASFNTNREEMGTFFTDLEQGKFDPGSLRKFILWLCSKFGGPEYEAAVKQFTFEAAAAEYKGLYQEDFLNDLAAAVKGCHSDELPEALRVIYDLLSADPEARRDFFINRLLISCLEEAHEEALKLEVGDSIENFTKKNELLLAINQFCVGNEMGCEGGEANRVLQLLGEIGEKIYNLAIDAMYPVIASSGDERDQHSQYLENLRNIRNIMGSKYVDKVIAPYFEEFNKMNGDFSSILGCFGESQDEQIENFKALVDGLRTIGREVLTGAKAHWETTRMYDQETLEKNWKQKASKFFEENQKLMWAALKMQKANRMFFQIIFRELIKYPASGSENVSNSLSLAARQVMEKAMEGEPSDFSNLLPEQVRLLCGGANLPALLENDQIAEKNKEAIHMVLKFIQKALARTDLQISFEDIMPKDVRDTTCRRLLKFVQDNKDEYQYDDKLVDFIKDGIEQRQAQRQAHRTAQGAPPSQ